MISAVVLTKNEEKNLKPCLESLKWCDEVVVVDDNSEDKTREIALDFGARIFERSLNGDFATQRNFGIEKARGDWVFFVDADERVNEDLAEEIEKVVTNLEFSGYFVKRKDFIFGRSLNFGESGKVKLLRLARKGAGKWVRPVHETWEVPGKAGELQNHLIHIPHPTVAEFLRDINFYTTLNSQAFFESGVKVGFWEIISYPPGKFLLNYFWRLGFLDGMAGFLMAMMMSFHSFLTRAKIWQLRNQYFSK